MFLWYSPVNSLFVYNFFSNQSFCLISKFNFYCIGFDEYKSPKITISLEFGFKLSNRISIAEYVRGII